MNSAAALKAFCGRNGGIVCTSSNAARVFDWAFERGERIFFFPDEHLGRNTGVKKGIPLDKMVVWDPFQPLGGNTAEAAAQRDGHPLEGLLLRPRPLLGRADRAGAHGLSRMSTSSSTRSAGCEVVQAADFDGSTEFIIDTIQGAAPGTTWAVGTEINLVNRLQTEMPGQDDLLPRSR